MRSKWASSKEEWTNKTTDWGHSLREPYFLFFPPFNLALQIFFKGTTDSALLETPLFPSLVDKSALWVRLEGLEFAAHSLHSHPIKNFHRLGQDVAHPSQEFAVPLCYTSFTKVFVNVLKSYVLRKSAWLHVRLQLYTNISYPCHLTQYIFGLIWLFIIIQNK